MLVAFLFLAALVGASSTQSDYPKEYYKYTDTSMSAGYYKR